MEDSLIIVDRIDKRPDATRSNILIRGVRSAYKMLEDIVRAAGAKKVPGETAIPAGRYRLTLRRSPSFSRHYFTKDDMHLIARKDWEKLPKPQRDGYHEHLVIHVEEVPGFSEILHHWGNTCADTRGCGLVGSSFGMLGQNTAVLASRPAYIRYYAEVAPAILKGGQYVEYRNRF